MSTLRRPTVSQLREMWDSVHQPSAAEHLWPLKKRRLTSVPCRLRLSPRSVARPARCPATVGPECDVFMGGHVELCNYPSSAERRRPPIEPSILSYCIRRFEICSFSGCLSHLAEVMQILVPCVAKGNLLSSWHFAWSDSQDPLG